MQAQSLTVSAKAKLSVRSNIRLIGLVCLFLVFSLFYNFLSPLFEAPDEFDHFRYVVWLAEGNGLPHLIDDLEIVGHEIGQPPLYYGLSALWVLPFDTADLESVAPFNPHWSSGVGINNVHYHTEAETFPYEKTALALHVTRLGMTLLGVVTIVGTYKIGQLLMPAFAWLPAALVALNPQFIFISSMLNNDNLITAVSTIILFILVKGIIKTPLRMGHAFLLGLLWGTAVLAKVSGLSIGIIIMLGLGFIAYQSKQLMLLVKQMVVVIIGFLLMAGWWFVRNWMLYGNFLAWDAFLSANSGMIRDAILTIPELWAGWWLTQTQTFWAAFNYELFAPPVFYLFANLLVIGGLIGLIVWFWRTGRYQLTAPQTLALLLLACWFGGVTLSLLRWMAQMEATTQGRLLFPAISSFALLIAFGLVTLLQRHRLVLKMMVGGLAVFAAVLPFIVIQPAFARPEPLPETAVIPNAADIQFGQQIALLGHEVRTEKIARGEPVTFDLYWESNAPIENSYVTALHIVDASGEVISRLDSVPYDGRYETAVWQTNTPFKDPYTLPPIMDEAAPGLATVWLRMYSWSKAEQLPVTVNGIEVGDGLILTTIKIPPNPDETYSPDIARGDKVANLATLTGYDLAQTESHIDITFYWQAENSTATDYTIFVHLLDKNGDRIAQGDSPPQNGTFPTTIWEAGEIIKDTHTISLPDSISAGTYTITIGFYDPTTGQRIDTFTATGEPWVNQIIELTQLTIK